MNRPKIKPNQVQGTLQQRVSPEHVRARLLNKAPRPWRGFTLALLSSLMLSSPATFSIQPAPAAIAGIAEADQLLIKNKFREAEDAYRSLLDSDDSGDAYAGLAVSLAKQGTPKSVNEAEKILKEARDKFPENPNVIAAGGYVSYVHSKGVASPAKRDLYLEAAAALCKRAIKANPDILIAQQTLGLVAIAQDDIDSAVEPLTKAKELAETPANLTLLAQVLLKTSPKEFDTPGDLLKQALSLKPDYAAAHLQKALLLEAQNKQEDAFSELQGVPEPERNAEWYCAEGDIYKTQGDGPAALAAWHESVRRDPHNPDPYRHLSEYYAMRGDGEVAIEQMHNALEILPNDMSLRGQLAELALRQDKLDVADTEYRTILATDPDDAAALLGLSRVGYRKARRDGGVYPEGWSQLMDKLQNVVTEQQVKGVVVKAGTKNLQQNIQLSEAEKFLSQNQFRKAREIFTGVINQNRDDPYQLLTLGEQAMNDGDLKSAEQAFTFAKEIPQVAPRADQDLSKIAQQRGEAARQTKLGDAMWKTPDVALDYYNQALIADPQYPPAYFGRYSLYERTDTDQAIRNAVCFLEAADDSNPDRSEVEANLVRLKKRVGPKAKGK